MLVKTANTHYTLKDMGDSGYIMSGHEKYCPTPTLVRLLFRPEVGCVMLAAYVGPRPFLGCKSHIMTTRVLEITP